MEVADYYYIIDQQISSVSDAILFETIHIRNKRKQIEGTRKKAFVTEGGTLLKVGPLERGLSVAFMTPHERGAKPIIVTIFFLST